MELQQVMIDPRSDNLERVVHVSQEEQGFALEVGGGDVKGVEVGCVVIEDAQEVVVVLQDARVSTRLRSLLGNRDGGMHCWEISHGAEGEVRGGRWAVGDRWRRRQRLMR